MTLQDVITQQTGLIKDLAGQVKILANAVVGLQSARHKDITDLNCIIGQLQYEIDGLKSNRYKQLMPGKN